MDDALALLRLQIEWGADEALAVSPVDRLSAARRPVEAARAAPPAAGMAVGAVPAGVLPADVVPADLVPADLVPADLVAGPALSAPPAPGLAMRAAQLAAGCATLDALREALDGFTDCPLSHTAGQLVFGDGPADAPLAVVLEVPDENDDATGRPLSGGPGRLLDAMLRSIGLSRALVRVMCLVPWRPPGGRPPTAIEIAACRPFLLAQLRLLPTVRHLLVLGAPVARALGADALPMRQLRGRWLDVAVEGRPVPLPALPMAPLRVIAGDGRQKAAAWGDLLGLRRVLDAAEGSRLGEEPAPD